jgi:hypothetical protein
MDAERTCELARAQIATGTKRGWALVEELL